MVAPQPFFRARGTPFSVLHRIRALTDRGHSVTLVTYPFGDDVEMNRLEIVRASRPPFIKDVAIGPSFAKLCLDVPLYARTSRLLRERTFDVIHSHEEAAFFCVHLAKRYGVPHVYDMHSSLPHQIANFARFNFRPIEVFFNWQENRVLDSCDGTITICEALARIVQERGVAVPHEMIENTGDDSKLFPARRRNVRKELGLGRSKVVLYTGTFEIYQGLDLLCDAFTQVAKAHPDTHLLLVGGRPEQVERYRRRAAQSSLNSRITLTGTVHPAEIQAYMQAADVIVSPRSKGTNTPLKIYGYMRSGKPIVATDRLTHTQTLSTDTAGLTPATPGGFAAGILRVLNDPAHGRKIAAAAAEYIERHYSDDAFVEKVNALYERVLSHALSAGKAQAVKPGQQ